MCIEAVYMYIIYYCSKGPAQSQDWLRSLSTLSEKPVHPILIQPRAGQASAARSAGPAEVSGIFAEQP